VSPLLFPEDATALCFVTLDFGQRYLDVLALLLYEGFELGVAGFCGHAPMLNWTMSQNSIRVVEFALQIPRAEHRSNQRQRGSFAGGQWRLPERLEAPRYQGGSDETPG